MPAAFRPKPVVSPVFSGFLQFQDDRKWNIPGFALLATCGRGQLAAGKTIRFAVTQGRVGVGTRVGDLEFWQKD